MAKRQKKTAPARQKKGEAKIVELPDDLYKRLADFGVIRGLTVEDLVRIATSALLRTGRYHTLDTKLSFGKFAGENLDTVIRLDPGYVRWLLANVESFCISDDATTLLTEIESLVEPGRTKPA